MIPGEKHYHAVQFYKDEDSLAATVARFLAEGIGAGQPAVVIATPSHTKTILRELETNDLDTVTLRRTGELHMFDAQKLLSSFMVGKMPDPMLFNNHLGDLIERLCVGRKPCPVRAYGEMVDLLWQEGNPEGATKLEILWNQLANNYSFQLLCGYAFGHFYKETRDPRYQQVCDLHSDVLSA